MKIAVITLSEKGLVIGEAISTGIPGADLYVHNSISTRPGIKYFEKVVALTAEIFNQYDGLVYVMPTGVVVRAIAAQIEHKKKDPAVVVVDVGGRHVVSLLSGHEGGANLLAVQVANLIGAEPVISTTTEAEKTVIAGVGCRRGAERERIKNAILSSLDEAGAGLEDVRLIATADVKANEKGIIDAANDFNVPLIIIESGRILAFAGAFEKSDYVMEKVRVPAVAEPAAMLAGRRTSLLLPRRKYDGITVALARENCLWLA